MNKKPIFFIGLSAFLLTIDKKAWLE